MNNNPYKYIRIVAKPMLIGVVTDELYATLRDKEVRLTHAAPHLLSLLQTAVFNLEMVAHLRGLERELLPFCDDVRKFISTITEEA